MATEVNKGNGCEIELSYGKFKYFMKVYFYPLEMWIDLRLLPDSAFLCAMCDGQQLIQSIVGEKGKTTRMFVNIEWVINEWGGNKELVDAIKRRKQMILDDLDRLKEKYAVNDE